MVSPLKNPRHEAFAQYLYEGLTQEEAHTKAGYKPSRPNACKLAKDHNILQRVAQLQERKAKQADVTIESISEMLLSDRKAAIEAEDISNRRQCAMDLAKLHGLIIDKAKTENETTIKAVSGEPITPEEWKAKHAQPLN